MKFNELKTTRPSKAFRVGRGISAGRGKTAGRGTKGQGSRKSGGVRPGFEGGQMPVYMRLPHLGGFRSLKTKAELVYTGQLDAIKKTVIDNQILFESGLIASAFSSVKLVLNGELKTKKEVKLQAASSSAIVAIEKAGGSFNAISRQGRPKTKTTSGK